MVNYDSWVEKKITVDKGDYATFSGTRVAVNKVALLAKRWATYSELFDLFPFLTTLDIQYAVRYYNND